MNSVTVSRLPVTLAAAAAAAAGGVLCTSTGLLRSIVGDMSP